MRKLICAHRIATILVASSIALADISTAPTPSLNAQPPATLPIAIPPAPVEIPLIDSPASRPEDIHELKVRNSSPLTTNQSAPPATGKYEPSYSTSNKQLRRVVVNSELDRQRDYIAPSLGATAYTIGPEQIQNIPGGEDASFQQVLLRAPGVVADSFGQFHVRGEHANVTYRINGVLLPQPISSFGQEVDTHLVNSFTLIDGSLSAQFGFHTAGVIDITTKTGAALNGGAISLYGGSYNTYQPSFEYGGTEGKWDYFVTATYLSNSHGIENPTDSLRPIHDDTTQTRGFVYLGYNIDETSRVSLILNGYNADYQIPNTPGIPQAFSRNRVPFASSSALNENQNEQEYYSVISYQKTADRYSVEASAFSRYGQLHFTPDFNGDLIFQGTTGDIKNTFITDGAQLDSAYQLNDQHTLRAGFVVDYTLERQDTQTGVFRTDPTTGGQASNVPAVITDNTKNTSTESGIYVQDEWKLAPAWTLDYGGRYDRFDSNFDTEDAFSPRANLVWTVDKQTTAHIGYSRYFVPPPVQFVPPGTLAKFSSTTNAPGTFQDRPPEAEHSNYYDLGFSHQFSKAFAVNVDGFYKESRHLLDLGQFGNALILSPYNYRRGEIYGVDVGSTYKAGPLSLFANLGWEQTQARQIVSQQFEFGADELAYINSHDVHLDHQATWAGSAGGAYTIGHDDMVYADVTYSSGLRSGFANTLEEPSYYPVQLGWQHIFHPNRNGKELVRLRVDVVNMFDQRYQIRDGNGIGTSSAQYGQRRSFFVGVSYEF